MYLLPSIDQIINESEVQKLRKSAIHVLSGVTTQRSAGEEGMNFTEYYHGGKKAVNLRSIKKN